jgi:hypothetical protein
MPREISTAAKAAAQAGHVIPIALAAFEFSSSVVRVASTPFNVTADADGDSVAETFTGVGHLGKIAPVEEGSEQRAYSLAFHLSGIAAELVSTALGENYQGREANLWIALMDPVSYQIIDSPVLIFAGLMDTMDMEVSKEAALELRAQSRLARWEASPNERYNDAAHQARYPGDKGLQFIEQTVEKEIVWPDN